jgi:hypothetical protein
VVAEHATHLHAAVLQVALNAPAEGFALALSLSTERHVAVVVCRGDCCGGVRDCQWV